MTKIKNNENLKQLDSDRATPETYLVENVELLPGEKIRSPDRKPVLFPNMCRLDIGWKLKRRMSSTRTGFNVSPSLLKDENKSEDRAQQP